MIRLSGIEKQFGGQRVLKGIDLAMAAGSVTALIGPSGSGKSTLLRCVNLLERPDAGQLVLGGSELDFAHHLSRQSVLALRQQTGMVFQNFQLFPHMTVLENVAYGPRRQGVNRGEARERAREALALVGLEALGERYPSGMSGGQQQRVALARAIVNKPKLLLLDEPLSALDMKLRKRMQLELKHLQAKLGIAFIFVTHDQEEAMTIADRIVVMNAGRIEQTGTSSAIYSAPASRFVADFIGEANLIDYQVTGNDEIRLGIRNQPLVRNTSAIPSQGVAVLRPEHLQVLEPAAAETPGCHEIHGTVSDVVTVGSHTLIHALIDGQMIIARTMGFPGPDMVAGSTVRLGFNPAHLHLIGESV